MLSISRVGLLRGHVALTSASALVIGITVFGSVAATASTAAAQSVQTNAQTLPFGRTVTGILDANDPALDGGGRYEVWRIQARAGQRVWVTMRGDGFDPNLLVNDGTNFDECVNCQTGMSIGNQSVIARWVSPTNGVVYIRTAKYPPDGTGAFTLRATSTAIPALSRTPIAFGQTGSGSWTQNDGETAEGQIADSFLLRLSRGQSVQLDLSGGEDTTDPYLQVYAPGTGASAAPLVEDDDGGPGLASRIRFTAEQTGTYRVIARPLSGVPTGTYRLAVGPIQRPPPPPEPIALSPGGRVEAQLSQSSPTFEDNGETFKAVEFRFMARAGEAYRLNAASSQFDTLLTVGRYLADGSFDSLGSDDDGAGEGTNSQLRFMPDQAGPYIVRVQAVNVAEGAFNVGLDRLAMIPTPAQGTPIATNSGDVVGALSDTGPFTPAGQSAAYYSVTLARGQAIRVRMTGENIDPAVEIGTGPPATMEAIAMDDDSGPGLNARLDFTAPNAGPYTIRAFDLSGAVTRPFTINVGPVVPPPPVPVGTPLTIGTSYAGSITGDEVAWDPDADQKGDVYSFDGVAGLTYQIAVNGLGMDAYVRARSATGNRDWQGDDDSGGELNALLSFTASETGRQSIVVSALGEGIGTYMITVTQTK